MKIDRMLWSSALATSLAMLAANAHAQSESAQGAVGGRSSPQRPVQGAPPATAPANTVEEVIVTAQKRSERLQDVPMSVAAASGDTLQKQGITDVSQLTKVVPGFTYQQGLSAAPVYGLRGISFYDVSGGASPAVSVYVDQVPLPYSVLTVGAPLDLERVEVLKGPQGTLFGENSTGGAINYIAAKPSQTFGAGVDISYGRFNQVDADGYVTGPISDTMSARIALRTDQRNNWQYSTTRNDTLEQRNFIEGRLLLDWNPVSALKLELNVNGWIDRSDTEAPQFEKFIPGGNLATAYPPALAYFSTLPQAPQNARAADWTPGPSYREGNRFFQTSLQGSYDFGHSIVLTSISNFITYSGNVPTNAAGTAYPETLTDVMQHFTIYTQELRLAGAADRLRWLVGVNYENDRLNETNLTTFNGTNSVLVGIHFSQFDERNDQRVATSAGFGNVDYDLGAGLKLHGGLRYTKQDRSYSGCEYGGPTAGGAGLDAAFGLLSTILSGSPTVLGPFDCISLAPPTFKPTALHSSLNQDNLSWRAGVDWKITGDTLLYANATKGYKAGGFSTIPVFLTNATNSTNAVIQESVLAYEAGFKGDYFGRTLQVDGAVFYYDYRNKQTEGSITIPFINSTVIGEVNVPAASIKGAELNVIWLPFKGLKLTGSGTYVDTRIDSDYIGTDPVGKQLNVKGEPLPATPKWQLTGDAEYDFPVMNGWNGYVGGTVSYHGDANALLGQNPNFVIRAYTLLDLRAGVSSSDGAWNIAVYGQNVTNAYYWTNVAYAADAVIRFAAFPVTYGVRISRRF